jgi:hypothetical protein
VSVKLADLEAPIEPVVLPGGREVAVVPINGIVMELYQAYRDQEAATKGSGGAVLYQIVAKLLPSATEEEVKALTPAQCAVVIELATRTYQAVAEASPVRPPVAAPAS